MTMKLPADHEATITPPHKNEPPRHGPLMIPGQKPPAFDPKKRYRYTWPGQPPRVVAGDELAALVKGADPSMLDIVEVGAAPTAPAAPEADDSDESTRARLAALEETHESETDDE